jgi:small ligand-binding sensory domain FIST
LHGGVQPGDLVQVCVAESSELISEVHRIVEQIDIGDFVPSAALIVSCAGRKWLLGGQIEFEVRALADRFGGSLPIAGFPSFGEIGPLWHEGKYTRNLFHNMTYVLLLFGTTATQ